MRSSPSLCNSDNDEGESFGIDAGMRAGYKELVETSAVVRFGDPMRDIYHFLGRLSMKKNKQKRPTSCGGDEDIH